VVLTSHVSDICVGSQSQTRQRLTSDRRPNTCIHNLAVTDRIWIVFEIFFGLNGFTDPYKESSLGGQLFICKSISSENRPANYDDISIWAVQFFRNLHRFIGAENKSCDQWFRTESDTSHYFRPLKYHGDAQYGPNGEKEIEKHVAGYYRMR